MKIVVCIKQVPDTQHVRLDPETNTLKREGVPSMVNPYDWYAVEAALSLRDRFGGQVTVLTMGPPQAEEALRQVVEYGVDEAVLLSDRAFAGADTWATGYTLCRGIQKIGDVDLVICGKQAADGDTAQVGPELAEWLGRPYVSFVRRVEGQTEDGKALVLERMMDDGFDVLELPLPGLMTVVKEIGQLRVPSLKGKMRAKKLDIPVWTTQDVEADLNRVGLSGSPTQVAQVFPPQARGSKTMLEGDPESQVGHLIELLEQSGILAPGNEQ